jgi:hypothetical protein
MAGREGEMTLYMMRSRKNQHPRAAFQQTSCLYSGYSEDLHLGRLDAIDGVSSHTYSSLASYSQSLPSPTTPRGSMRAACRSAIFHAVPLRDQTISPPPTSCVMTESLAVVLGPSETNSGNGTCCSCLCGCPSSLIRV